MAITLKVANSYYEGRDVKIDIKNCSLQYFLGLSQVYPTSSFY